VQEAFDGFTRSAGLNEVIRHASEVMEGKGSEGALRKSLDDLTALRRQIRGMIRRELPFQEKSSSAARESKALEGHLERLREGIDELYRFFKDGRKEHLGKGMETCRHAVEHLFAIFDHLKAEEEKRPLYSELPYQNELMRTGHGVITGTISPSALRERVEGMKMMVRGFYEHFDSLAPHPREREYFDEHRGSVKKALKKYLEGLDEMALYFSDNKQEHVRKGMEMTREASEKVLELQRGLEKAGQGPVSKLCFKCGRENEAPARHCIHCSAVFPSFDGSPPPGVDLRMDREGNVKAARHIETELTRKISSAAASVRDGSMAGEKFGALLDELEKKARQSLKDKERLGRAQELFGDLPSADVLVEIDDMMAAGFADVLEGIEQMRRYLGSGDESHLAFGLESVLTGTDRLAHVSNLTAGMKSRGPGN